MATLKSMACGIAKVCRVLDVFSGVFVRGDNGACVFYNNLGQIVQSRNVKEDILLSIFSLFGFFKKLSSAPLSAFARLVVV